MSFTKADKFVEELIGGIVNGNRGSLAKAITLVESQSAQDITVAELLLERLSLGFDQSFRIGVSGSPGVGKSTFIEALGTSLLAQGKKVAVLAVDPSSPKTQGSVLGDKTRMPKLSIDERAFVRPSPSSGVLGGVTAKTAEVIRLCEAAAYDVIFVETIGVGQNEVAVAELVDLVVLLLDPAAGDELQGIKRGVVEFADFIAVNKADGDLKSAAKMVQQQYASALSLSTDSQKKSPHIFCMSAYDGIGIDELWNALLNQYEEMRSSGFLEKKRAEQSEQWFWKSTADLLMKNFRLSQKNQMQLKKILPEVRSGKVAPSRAAKIVLSSFIRCE